MIPHPHSERGQGLVEFALIFPILVLCIVAVFDLGRGIYAYNTVSNAARDGVRIAVVNQNAAGVGCDRGSGPIGADTTKLSAHDCAVAGAIGLSGVTATVEYQDYADPTQQCTPIQVGCIAVVTVSAAYQPLTPIIGSIIGSIDISSTSTQAVEFVCPISGTVCVPGT